MQKKLNDKEYLQEIADTISNETGIENKYVSEISGSYVWDFNFGISSMRNKNDKVLLFSLCDDVGNELCAIIDDDVVEFKNKVISMLIRYKKQEKAIKIAPKIMRIDIKKPASLSFSENVKESSIIFNTDIISEKKVRELIKNGSYENDDRLIVTTIKKADFLKF